MSNPYDNLKRSIELRAEAALIEAGANQDMRKALEDLEVYIQEYDQGLQVCPQIKKCMIENPWLKKHYIKYWEACAS